jgi:hypothetical protein
MLEHAEYTMENKEHPCFNVGDRVRWTDKSGATKDGKVVRTKAFGLSATQTLHIKFDDGTSRLFVGNEQCREINKL